MNSIAIHRKAKGILVEVIVYLFVLLFVYTAGSKLMTFESFKNVLGHSPLIQNYNTLIAWAIVSIEIVIGVVLIIPKSRKIGLYGSFLLMLLFTVYVIYMVFSGIKLPCYCGGVISSMTWQQHIWFNLFFTALAGIGIRLSKK